MTEFPYIYGETEAEFDPGGALRTFFDPGNWPIPVSQELARAADGDGALAFLCLRHPEMGLITSEEFGWHLRIPPHDRVCIGCGASVLTPDDIMRWTAEVQFPVRVTWDSGETTDGEFPGGMDIFWCSLAQRCMKCLTAGLAIAIREQTQRLRDGMTEHDDE